MRALVTIVVFIMLSVSSISAQMVMLPEQQIFNFGNVGIDFKVHHTFYFYNETDKPITITDLDVSCDCSLVNPSDSIVAPGDTVYFDLTFITADYYGPTNKSFKVFTDNPQLPEFQFFFLATVGQWLNGLKPDPISLFFLPGKKNSTITIPNKSFDSIEIESLMYNNEQFTVTEEKEKASKDENLRLVVTPREKLAKGTSQSSLTVVIKKTGQDQNTILTIPVKIVKY